MLNRILRHDIRNDMNVVLGWLTTVEAGVDGELHEAVQRSIAAGEHVVELTDLAREYVDVVVEEDVFDRSSIALATTIENELTLQRESYQEATFRIDGSLPDVDIVGSELVRSVFRNVLVNAVQHNDDAEPVVTVSATVEPETVRVAIADNGPGVDEEQRERIFGKGDRGLDSAGTGMGLYLSREIVEGFGGEIWVEDNDPEGAVFFVELPRVDSDE